MDIKPEIESMMPGALTKWISVLSIALSVGLYKFYPDLPKSWLPQTEEVYFLTRLLLSGSVLLLGSVSLVVLLSRHDKKIRLQYAVLKSDFNALADDSQGRATFNKALKSQHATNAQELDVLKKSHAELERIASERKFLLDVAEKKITDLSKPIEPASASSPPDPPRRSFPGFRIPRDK